MLGASQAAAQGGQLPIQMRVQEMVSLPEQSPRITVLAQGMVSNLRLAVSERGAAVVSKTLGRLNPGESQVITWSAAPGLHEYLVDVSGRTEEGQMSVSSPVTVAVLRPIEISLRKEEVDLGTRLIPFSINNPASHLELNIYNPSGRILHQQDIELRPAQAGQRLQVSWPDLPESIGRIELRVFDVSNAWVGVELLPFMIDIPHVEVLFETAKWKLLPGELPKLDAAYELILSAIREHGADLKARLYVLGFTDTVGSVQDNIVLSRNRADAIARYFLSKGGITLPIMACGFGETRLAVQTGDNVDEARNRRAQYILAAQEPVPGEWAMVSPGAK